MQRIVLCPVPSLLSHRVIPRIEFSLVIFIDGDQPFFEKVAKAMPAEQETSKERMEKRSKNRAELIPQKWNINMDLQVSRHVERQFPIVKQGINGAATSFHVTPTTRPKLHP